MEIVVNICMAFLFVAVGVFAIACAVSKVMDAVANRKMVKLHLREHGVRK